MSVLTAVGPDGKQIAVKADVDGSLQTTAVVNLGDVQVTLGALGAGDEIVGRVKITDGVDTVDVLSTGGPNVLGVQLIDAAGNPVTSLGGGGSSDATASNQLAILGAVDGLETLLAGIQTTVSAIQTAAQLIDNSIAGSETQVDVVAALPAGANTIGSVGITGSIPAGTNNIGDVDIASAIPAGTNNIGDVDIASPIPAGTNNIGDVDVLTVPANPFGTNTEAVVAAGADGSMQQRLRRLTTDLATVITTLTDGTQAATARGGGKGSTTPAVVTATPSGANHNGLDVVLYDTAGNPLTSIGGGTQYVTGNGITATPTGTVILHRDGSNVARSVSPTTPMPTQVTDGTNFATVRDVTGANNALNVAITAPDGSHVPSFGGGTQYAAPIAQALPATVTAIGWHDGAQIQPASTLKPLPVNGTFALSGETHMGEVGGNTGIIQPAITVSTSPAYSVGDVVGGEIILNNAVRIPGGTGVLQSLTIFIQGNIAPALDILVMNADPAGTYTDNAAFTFSTSDPAKLMGKIHVATTDYVLMGASPGPYAFCAASFTPFAVFSSATQNLWLIIVTQTAVTMPTTSALKLTVGILRD